jgi:transposase-like protein
VSTYKTDEDDEFDRIEREIAIRKTCQVCRLQPADVQGKNSRGAPQWRCQTCHDLKNRGGFTKGKQ